MDFVFLFKQKTRYEMRISDWSSDVCSSDLVGRRGAGAQFDVLVLDLGQHQPDGAEPRLVAAFHRGDLRSLDVIANHTRPHVLQISERPSLARSFLIR